MGLEKDSKQGRGRATKKHHRASGKQHVLPPPVHSISKLYCDPINSVTMAAAPNIEVLLLGAQSVDHATRSAAEEQLRLLHDQNFPAYIGCIATEMGTPSKPTDSRRMAGILLKGMLTAKEEARRAQLHARWVALDPAVKQHVRDALLLTLTTEVKEVRHTAAMALAAVAAVDLPRKVCGGEGSGGRGRERAGV